MDLRDSVYLRQAGRFGLCFSPNCRIDIRTMPPQSGTYGDRQQLGSTILLVDDEASILETYALLLEQAGHRVTGAASAEEAIAILASSGFDLVITDLAMERPHAGLEVVDSALQHQPSIPAIIITGFATPEVIDVATRRGVAVLSKPVDLGRLARAIEGQGSRSRAGTA